MSKKSAREPGAVAPPRGPELSTRPHPSEAQAPGLIPISYEKRRFSAVFLGFPVLSGSVWTHPVAVCPCPGRLPAVTGATEQDDIGWIEGSATVLQLMPVITEDPAVRSTAFLTDPTTFFQKSAHQLAPWTRQIKSLCPFRERLGDAGINRLKA